MERSIGRGEPIWLYNESADSYIAPAVSDVFSVDEVIEIAPGTYEFNWSVSMHAGGYVTQRVATADTTMTMTLQPLHPAGDADCSGNLNGHDIPAFLLALTDPAAYATAFPDCLESSPADLDGDGAVDAADAPLFIASLLSVGS